MLIDYCDRFLFLKNSEIRTRQCRFPTINYVFTRSQALPGNADPEALPPISVSKSEAEPLDIGS